jgi:hypothetical protein
VIRKDEDVRAMYRHDRFVGWARPYEDRGTARFGRALWVDDFVSSGETQRRAAKLLLERGARMEMMYLYRDNELSPGRTLDSPRITVPSFAYDEIDRIPF